jgi:archaellum biogenesis ATPase FlaH
LARKKKTTESNNTTNSVYDDKGSTELSLALGDAFGQIIKRDFGQYVAPPPLVTPTNIIPLDYLLGGGIVSSKPVMLSSTPETGKSTFCFQFSKAFLQKHDNGVVVYLDIEGAGNITQTDDDSISATISRIDSFGLNDNSFQYQPVILTIAGVFDLLEKLASIKQAFEEKLKKEFCIMVIWDSLSATRSSKTDSVEDVNSQIGFKARELTFKLEKFSPLISFKRITFLVVDQVRANLKIALDGPYKPTEKSVGNFNDYRAATSINSLNHLTGQWLYFSKKKNITVADGMGIDGWEVNVTTEKNKYAPSQYTITCIFDKINGFDKFWSEYRFMSEMCPSENKIYKKSEKNLTYPLTIRKSGPQVKLVVFEEKSPDSIIFESKTMYRKDMKDFYNTNDEFQQWFDYAVEISSKNRIVGGLFKCQSTNFIDDDDIVDETAEIISNEDMNQLIDTQNQNSIDTQDQNSIDTQDQNSIDIQDQNIIDTQDQNSIDTQDQNPDPEYLEERKYENLL